MVTANVLMVEQKMDFSTKSIRNYIVLELGGKMIHAEVSDINELSALIEEAMGSQNVEAVDALADTQRAGEPDLEQEVCAWAELSEDRLSAPFKAAFSLMSVPPVLSAHKIDELVAAIAAEYKEADWEYVLSTLEGPPPQAPPEASESNVFAPPVAAAPAAPAAPIIAEASQPTPSAPPALGQLQWVNAVLTPTTQARRVPQDDYGYPIVPGKLAPPSKVQDRDEDGVGQL